jgi:hypothetical protein
MSLTVVFEGFEPIDSLGALFTSPEPPDSDIAAL